jgi:hypothetical protein
MKINLKQLGALSIISQEKAKIKIVHPLMFRLGKPFFQVECAAETCNDYFFKCD